jgi:hypothetical protein
MPGRIAMTDIVALISRLCRDRSGNTLAMIAAALVPLLAMVGGGIDMGRSYLSQTRLQQACDAGVLAARKKLGSQFITTGEIPSDVADVGNRFFNVNFSDGSYGTANRSFQMTLEEDLAISGVATVDVPTTIMTVFGYSNVDIAVECEAKLNFSNSDILFVLDVTGSMAQTNPGDSAPRIEVLKQVVQDFHGEIEGSKSPGTRVRYGFLPYSSNVRVADILKSDWMVDEWTYQSRVPNTPTSFMVGYYYVQYDLISGSSSPIAPYTSSSCPANTKNISYSPTTVTSTSPYTYWYESTTTGTEYFCTPNDGVFTVTGTLYNTLVMRSTWTWAYDAPYYSFTYKYKPIEYDVSSLKDADGDNPPLYGSIPATLEGNSSNGTTQTWNIYNTGCIEERDTYEIDDYDNVDFSRALDLDIDLVPTPGNPSTQWRPMLPEIVFERTILWNGSGNFSVPEVDSSEYFLNPAWASTHACPAAAKKLAEMNASDVSTYLGTLAPTGDTYHDIGMIWGARMLSPTGIFADENADVDGKPTSRHMIFLTDGQTETFDINYGAYGVEPLDRRRWRSAAESGMSLDEVVEKRFGVACAEAKKRNITVWVIGFGTTLNPMMMECAGPGRYFEAQDASALSDVFSKIAAQLGDLRVSK